LLLSTWFYVSSPFLPISTANLNWYQNIPFSTQFKDAYYSIENGLSHSQDVFIDGNHLINRWAVLADENNAFNIAEIGFGSGLNFLHTWMLWEQYAPRNAHLHFISCDNHPFKKNDLIKSLNNWPQLKAQAEQLIEKYPILTPGYHHLVFNDGRIKLTLMLGDAFECYEQLLVCGESHLELSLRGAWIDAWYLNGFSPEKDESMWSNSLISVIAMLSKLGTTLAADTAATSVQSALDRYGFIIKADTLSDRMTASYSSLITNKLRTRTTPWHASFPQRDTSKSAIIIGAGLAGCFTAYSLVRRGWNVTLIDELNKAGMAGSANQRAILFPKLSAYKSPLTQFMLLAFLYANQVYQGMLKQEQFGELNGALVLAYNEKEKKAQHSLQHWLLTYPELGVLVDDISASQLSGLTLDKSGLFIPLSGWINSPDLCDFLINSQHITLVTNVTIEQLTYRSGNWEVNDNRAPILILANGQKINSFNETHHFPVKSMRGQMTSVLSTNESSQLKVPLCAEGHVLPALNGCHWMGATYDPETSDPLLRSQDNDTNIAKLSHMSHHTHWSTSVVDHWSGIRAATPDYLPLVGPVAKAQEFLVDYEGLASNSKRWIPKVGSHYSGLYACAGFGSRGLTTIPLCAEWLASLINNEIGGLPRNLIHALSPNRFLRRDITRGFF
jgi:tRNA 5-methylaminomethyl-2-thiouridine biosynthesis bifunctional protein